ncbi:MAG: GDYXXLXY domain-containing protein [Gaiellales bacterium]
MIAKLDRRQRIIAVLVILQVLVLVSIALLHGARIASGTEVRVRVVPVDPIDIARGAYVDLRYELQELDVPPGVATGDQLYVVLGKPDADGVRDGVRVERSPGGVNDGELWIRLRADGSEGIDANEISTFYASANNAQEIERELVNGGVAVLSLSSNGQPTLLDVTG